MVMKNRRLVPATLAMAVVSFSVAASAVAQTNNPGNPGTVANPTGDTAVSGVIDQKPLLTPAQRSAIYTEVSKDKSKTSSKDFSPVIGADVPPMIELYALPERLLPRAFLRLSFTNIRSMVENKVVVVDPTRMRVIDVIGPTARQ